MKSLILAALILFGISLQPTMAYDYLNYYASYKNFVSSMIKHENDHFIRPDEILDLFCWDETREDVAYRAAWDIIIVTKKYPQGVLLAASNEVMKRYCIEKVDALKEIIKAGSAKRKYLQYDPNSFTEFRLLTLTSYDYHIP